MRRFWVLVVLLLVWGVKVRPLRQVSICSIGLQQQCGMHMMSSNGKDASVSRTINILAASNNGKGLVALKQKKTSPSSSYLLPTCVALGLALKYLVKKWISSNASRKFAAAGGWFGIYATIPVIAGLVNMATNKLAVMMIFSPLEFLGVDVFKSRKEGQPGALFGWQGIVPSKARKMGTDIADTLLSLLDVKAIFGRLRPEKIAEPLTPRLLPVFDAYLRKLLCDKFSSDSMLYDVGQVYKKFLTSKLNEVIVRLVTKIQLDPARFLDLKNAIVGMMVKDKRLIVDLFQRCGREELKFIVSTGLYGGFLLGVVQMAFWLMWDPWWSLALGGAIVGYVTDWFALKIMFEPVEPVALGKWNLQGLFLTRQQEVSLEFAQFSVRHLLTPDKIWNAICFGSRSEEFTKEIALELKDELAWLLPDMEEKGWIDFAKHVQSQLPACAESTHSYMDLKLNLMETIRSAMSKMSSKEFEKVLHPIFQEDELTLILVGTALGAAAGFAQVPFYL